MSEWKSVRADVAGTIDLGGHLSLGFGACASPETGPGAQDLAAPRCDPRQIALAWMLARSGSVLPIPGTGSVSHLDDNIAAAAVKPTPADVAAVTRHAH